MKKAESDPRMRILDAAENAMGEQGFAGASLRKIVKEARVNLATVYYYFGSKRGLLEAVLKRRFGPLREEHQALLEEFEREAQGKPLAVEQILEALLLPPLSLIARAPSKGRAVTRLIGRIVGEPNAQTQEVLRSQHAEVRSAFLTALQRSLPHVPRAVLQWRLEFTWGALAFTLCNPRKIEVETKGACDPADTNCVMAHMMRFFSSGFKAPADEVTSNIRCETALRNHGTRKKQTAGRELSNRPVN